MIGEFSSSHCSEDKCTVEDLYQYAADQGYSGIWDWSLLGGDNNDDEELSVEGSEICSILEGAATQSVGFLVR